MNYWWYLILIAIVSTFSFSFWMLKDRPRLYLGLWAAKAAFVSVILFIINYFELIAFVGPLWGVIKVGAWFFALSLIGDFCLWWVYADNSFRTAVKPRHLAPVFAAALGAIVMFSAFGIYRCGNVGVLRDISGVKKAPAGTKIDQVDIKHIRQVPKEYAEWRGSQVIGKGGKNYGSVYVVGDYHIQRVAGRLYWVAPLEFRGFSMWWRQDTTPGFIMVDAEDPKADVRLIDSHRMRYMPSAYWSKNLERHVYMNGYAWVRLVDWSFEVDDRLRPWWVVTVLKPTLLWSGEKVLGVVIVNPMDGSMKHYGKGNVPDWVDRVVPEKIAEEYIQWWGEYVHGWWNSVWGKNDIVKPTEVKGSPDVWLTYGKDGQPYWFTGVTSKNDSDSSLTGYIMMNSRTGDTTYYELTGANENAVIQAINNQVSYRKWHATQPILYNIYGELTWVVPVLGQSKTFQGIAMVNARDTQVVFGETKVEALAHYLSYLASRGVDGAPTSTAKMSELKGCKVERISAMADGKGATFCLWLDCKRDVMFTAAYNSKTTMAELPLTLPGDEVSVRFIETGEGVVPVESFDNLGIALRKSQTQSEFEKEKKKHDGRKKENWDQREKLRRQLEQLESK